MHGRALALVAALLAATVSCAPTPQELRTDITILRDNDLQDTKSPSADVSAIFLSENLSLDEASSACRKLGEQLWLPDSNSTQRLLDILGYQEGSVSAVWIATKENNRPNAIGSRGDVLSPNTNDTLPALCTHTAPFSNGAAQNTGQQWQVTIRSKKDDVLGFRDRNSFRFLGLRFASKTRRFAYPILYKGSGGNISALKFGSPCFQGFGGDEDCQFLNIYTPYLPRSGATDKRLRAVMFWIHGGALTSGFGSDPLFDGGNLASRGDVVVVTINYRLGTLGYLALDDGVTNGNYGLADQIVALDWVTWHIRDFGGDPARITIFGQSAGGSSVRALMASPRAAGKFAGAITMSSLGGLAYGRSYSKYLTIDEQMNVVGNEVLNATNCTDAASQVDCLRQVPLDAFGAAARFMVVDGTYLKSDELQLNGDPLGVHVMMGITSEDGLPFLNFPANKSVVNDTHWLTTQGLPAPTRSLFPPGNFTNQTRAAFGVGARLATDAMFRCIGQATVYAGLDSGVLGSEVYYYELERTYQTPQWPKLDLCEAPRSKKFPNGNPESSNDNLRCHSGDLLPLFGNLVRQGLPFRDENDLPWQQYIVDSFTSFARTYNPNPDTDFLRARGFGSTLEALENTGPWKPSVKDAMKMRIIKWPVEDEMMRDFKDVEQCEWLELPMDYYL